MFGFASILKRSAWAHEIFYILLFGSLSLLFGLVNHIEGGMSNFKEIPLLIHIFYAKTPVSVLFTSIISSIPIGYDSPFINIFLIHLPGLVFGWYAHRYFVKVLKNSFVKAIVWIVITCIYYLGFILTVWAYLSSNSSDNTFIDLYLNGIDSVKFEMFATMFVTSLYLIQLDIRIDLEEHKNNLEEIVVRRTIQLEDMNEKLIQANEELKSSHEEVKAVNDNLDNLVKRRSAKIEEQLKILNQYADMNSHEVRAPLARILGLLDLINKEENSAARADLLVKLNYSAEELDTVIKNMNRLLEKETLPDPDS